MALGAEEEQIRRRESKPREVGRLRLCRGRDDSARVASEDSLRFLDPYPVDLAERSGRNDAHLPRPGLAIAIANQPPWIEDMALGQAEDFEGSASTQRLRKSCGAYRNTFAICLVSPPFRHHAHLRRRGAGPSVARRSPPDLLHSKLHDLRDQRQGHRLIEGELNGAFRALVSGQLVLEFGDTGRRGIEPDVPREGGEVHQILVEDEGRNAVLDGLGGVGRRLLYGRSQLLQQRSHLRPTACDVGVDILGL